jgi:hypothetical protein
LSIDLSPEIFHRARKASVHKDKYKMLLITAWYSLGKNGTKSMTTIWNELNYFKSTSWDIIQPLTQ